MSLFHLAFVLSLSLPGAARSSLPLAVARDDAQAAATAVKPAPDAVPTEDECLALAQQVLDAVGSGDAAAIEHLMDWDTLFSRATADIQAAATFRSGFIGGVKQSFGDVCPFARALAKAATNTGGEVHFLRLRSVDKDPTLLFRVLNGTGLDYYELRVGRRKTGEIAITDTLTFLSGDWLSDAIRRFYIPAAAGQSKALRAQLSARDRAFLDHFNEFGALGKAIQAGEWSKALEIYAAMPAELQREKYVLLMRMVAAQKTDDETYLAALEDLRKDYGTDPSLCLHAVDFYLLKKDTEHATAAFDVIDAAVGGDAYLDFLQGGLLVETKDFAAALEHVTRGLSREPEMVNLWWMRVTCQLGLEQFEDVYTTLVSIDASFEVTWEDFTQKPIYAGFVASPWHAKWLEHLAAADKEDKDG
jgi:hypothetical protein